MTELMRIAEMQAVETRWGTADTGEVRWPESLGAWLGKRVLADVVVGAVRKAADQELNPPVASPMGIAFGPRMLLAMLTYCYADGVYGSQDAEQIMREDTLFRVACGDEFPDWRRLRRFRRDNHPVLSRVLTETFRVAWSLRGRTPQPPGTRGPNESQPSTSSGSSRPLDEAWLNQEVEDRIERAMFIDRMALDD
jgi:hypothetical protein